MAVLSFVCPEHNVEINSNIETDPRTFRKCREIRIKLYCPFCGIKHADLMAEGCVVGQRVAWRPDTNSDRPRTSPGATSCVAPATMAERPRPPISRPN